MREKKPIVTRFVLGYLLKPDKTFDTDRDNGYSFAVLFFATISLTLIMVHFLLLHIDDVLRGVPVSQILDSIIDAVFFASGYIFLEILIILTIIHLTAKYWSKDAKFSNSFKITLISYAYVVAILALISIIGNILYFLSSPEFKYGVMYPFFIAAVIIFIWVAANGIKVLHGLSDLKSYAIATIAIAAANLAIYCYGLLYFSQFIAWG